MYYFLNENMQFAKSGIEGAEIQRLNLFNQHQVPAKIVTRVFAMNLHDVTTDAKISDDHFVNLFDYFCGTTHVEKTVTTVDDVIAVGDDITQKAEDNKITYLKDNKLYRIAYLRQGATNPREISNVQYFDTTGRTTKMSWWNSRGFLCLNQYFDNAGNIFQEHYLDLEGNVKLEKLHYLNRANKEKFSYKLDDFEGVDYLFDGLHDLTRFFYDQLNKVDGGYNVFISDRTTETGWGLRYMETTAFKVLHLHNNHLADDKDIMHDRLNNFYASSLNNLDKWDGIIAPSSQQKKDVEARWGTKPPVFNIRIAFVKAEDVEASKVPFAQRENNLVVHVARLAPEKQQDSSIKAFEKVLKVIPDAKLELWGYANGDVGDKMRALVREMHLEDSVLFKGYTSNIAEVYNRAQVGLLPSRAEGFPLTLIEAQSHGLPMIANDIHYGPADILEDGKSGILTKNGDNDGLADAIIDLLTHKDKLAAFSEEAYQNALRFTDDNTFEQWQTLFDYAAKKRAKVLAAEAL